MIADTDLALRFVAVGSSLLLLAAILAGQVRRPIKIALAGVLVGSIAYSLNLGLLRAASYPLEALRDLLSLLTPFWTWLFARRLFERPPASPATLAILLLLVTCWALGWWGGRYNMVGFYGIHIASLALLADLFGVAWRGRADDLIEKRRLVRLWLPILMAALAAGILGYELVNYPHGTFPKIEMTLIIALNLFAGATLLQADPQLLCEVEDAETDHSDPQPGSLTPQEIVLLDKLKAAMEAKDYRITGLTIGMLAERLDVPEHRLRALINRRLGHRNFSAFLNRHRIEEARAMLADRESVNLPVLTIAMDLGYNSLPTFNRAFRELAGCTPTEFRQQSIGQ
ncbi:MAG: helix-turn-helix domain-containing protein [Sphingomonadaceae bacterium]|nr:helix-turn-helix domain-containing protein [Sphingomonadaceae bacterium]